MSAEGRIRYTYTENVLKNRSGGVGQLDVSHKVVHQFAHPELGERCHVSLLDRYFSKIPDSAKANDIFYLRPKCLRVKMLHGFHLCLLVKIS